MALASISDLELRTGTIEPGELTRATVVLDDASNAVRAYTGQMISLETTTVRSRPAGCTIWLSQRPVIAVAGLNDINDNAIEGWVFDGIDRITLAIPVNVVDVTYVHGYDRIPDDIIGVVCAIAARSLASDADPGITSEGIAGYSYSRGTVGAAGPWGMFDQERTVLDRYRRVGASARTGRLHL